MWGPDVRPLVAVIGQRCATVPILRFSATLASEAICEAVYAGGGEPVIVHGPAADPGAGLAQRLQRFDGVLLPGGADLDPQHYGQQPVAETAGVVAFQDELDLATARAIVASDRPALAICRGMQVLNVALGGTLHQHLAETSVRHHDAIHDVDISQDSRLREIMDCPRIDVSSYHHQGLDRLGDELVVTATSADGVIEAVEHRTADVIAVQWHPEDRHATSATDAALFADLVERARKRAAWR